MPARMESAELSVESRIADIGTDLARTFNGVLNALPGAPHRPQLLARALGVNTVLTSRILKAAQQHDPLAVAHIIPGPEPLRRLLRAAARKKVAPALIREAEAAVDRFQQLIDVEAGDRSALDALISGWLPGAREKVELIAKQSVFRGMSQLLGTASNVEHHTVMFYPSETAADRADAVWASVTLGLRRVRPGLVVKYDTMHSPAPLLTLSGQPVDGLHSLLLEPFCSKPLPQLEVRNFGDKVQYTLTGEGVGVQSAVNIADATFLPNRKELYRGRDEPPRKAVMGVGIAIPTRTFIFDVLLHESIYRGQRPALDFYRTAGAVNRSDADRDVDRLDVLETLQPLGQGLSRFRSADTPAYQEMLRHICSHRNWDVDCFRGFRCRIEYPIYSSEIVMAFDLPLRT